MAKKLYPEENIQAIATAIRGKNGSSDTYTVGEMAAAIDDIPTGGGGDDTQTLIDLIERDITSIRTPDGCTVIGSSTFSNCTKLEEAIINEGVTVLESSCFSNAALTKIDLPSTLQRMENYALYQCSRMETIICRAITPPTIQTTSLQGVPSDANIYVPSESVDAYKSASRWSGRAAYIQAIQE